MLLKDLPEEIRKIAEIRKKEFLIKENAKDINRDHIHTGFTWLNTPEGSTIWSEVDRGNYDLFYKFHPDLIPEEHCIINDYQIF